jgi:hypothetical protein
MDSGNQNSLKSLQTSYSVAKSCVGGALYGSVFGSCRNSLIFVNDLGLTTAFVGRVARGFTGLMEGLHMRNIAEAI